MRNTLDTHMHADHVTGGGRSREDFVALMLALDLPHPRHIERAVPANRACGRPAAVQQG
jgi:glyoxylase-like metal-dependent hydrolase (beta-lactamase superfamily II)